MEPKDYLQEAINMQLALNAEKDRWQSDFFEMLKGYHYTYNPSIQSDYTSFTYKKFKIVKLENDYFLSIDDDLLYKTKKRKYWFDKEVFNFTKEEALKALAEYVVFDGKVKSFKVSQRITISD